MSVSLIDGHIDDDVLTDEQIIKAFECCVTYEFCTGCPLVDNCLSSYSLLKLTLDLINRQKAEIERLENTIEDMSDRQITLVERTEAYAIKEFAEQVKMAFYYEFDELIPSIMADKIDNLVKEMVGEG